MNEKLYKNRIKCFLYRLLLIILSLNAFYLSYLIFRYLMISNVIVDFKKVISIVSNKQDLVSLTNVPDVNIEMLIYVLVGIFAYIILLILIYQKQSDIHKVLREKGY